MIDWGWYHFQLRKAIHNTYMLIDHWRRWFNTLRPGQNGRHFPDDIFKSIFLNENVRISISISLKFVLKGPISNIPALIQIMAWRRPGDKPLSEPMMVSLLTHICVTRPQWVKILWNQSRYIFCRFFILIAKFIWKCLFLKSHYSHGLKWVKS